MWHVIHTFFPVSVYKHSVNTAADCSLFKRFVGRRSTGGANGVALGNYILTNFSLHNYVLTSPWVGLCLLGAKDGRENKFL